MVMDDDSERTILETVLMDGHGRKWTKTDGTGWRWPVEDDNEQKWAQNGRRMTVQNENGHCHGH